MEIEIIAPTENTGATLEPSAIILAMDCPILRDIIALWERVAEKERRFALALIQYFVNA